MTSLTAETVTDEMIRELRSTPSPITGNCGYLCTIALGEGDESTAPQRYEARQRVAEILNARATATPHSDESKEMSK